MCACVRVRVLPGTNVCVLLQRRVPLRHVRDADDRAGNSRGGQVLHPLQAGPVRRAGLHLRTPEVSTPPPRSSGRRPVPVPLVEVNTRPFADTRTTRSQWETDSGPGGTRREGPPPSPPPGLWRRRSRRRRSPSPAFSRSERGNGAAPPPLRVCSGRFTGCSDEESVSRLSVPDSPAEEKRRWRPPCPSPARPGRSLPTQRPFPPTCSSAGRAAQRCFNAHPHSRCCVSGHTLTPISLLLPV